MSLTRGDHLKRQGTYLTILFLSPCGRYAMIARAQGQRIVREAVALKALRKGTYNVTRHSRRYYQDVLVIEETR